MKKRMTDADIWRKKWFRALSPEMKCLFFYLKDTCDAVGVFEYDSELIKFETGIECNEDSLKVFGKRIVKINDTKHWIKDFCKFQYGAITANNPAHKAYIKLLHIHELLQLAELDVKPSDKYYGDIQGLVRGYLGDKDKDKETEKATNKDKDKDTPSPSKVMPNNDIKPVYTSKDIEF